MVDNMLTLFADTGFINKIRIPVIINLPFLLIIWLYQQRISLYSEPMNYSRNR